MFESILKTQGQALEQLMAKQPTVNSQLMDEAKQDLANAIAKAVAASKQTVTE